jgi:hypothetical protein
MTWTRHERIGLGTAFLAAGFASVRSFGNRSGGDGGEHLGVEIAPSLEVPSMTLTERWPGMPGRSVSPWRSGPRARARRIATNSSQVQRARASDQAWLEYHAQVAASGEGQALQWLVASYGPK